MDYKLLNFLLVEDDDDHAHLVLRSLSASRVANRIDRVADGFEALSYLRQEGEFADCPRPDVILLDLKLPKVDGHDVLKAVKHDPHLSTIPVVVLTTSDAEADRLRAYELRANSYLVKPVDFDRFHKLVNDLGLYWGVWNRPARDV